MFIEERCYWTVLKVFINSEKKPPIKEGLKRKAGARQQK
jgi:hypothetical protein